MTDTPDRDREPQSAVDWIALGRRLIAASDLPRARECFRRAAEIEPANAMHWARLGKCEGALRNHDAAMIALREACARDPRNARYPALLAAALREQNEADAAVAAAGRALALDPLDLQAAVAAALTLPPIYASEHELGSWRARYAAGLDKLHRELPRWLQQPERVLELVDWSNFYLAYQGQNDRELQRRYAELLATLMRAALPALYEYAPRRARRKGRLRIGFMSGDLRASTVGDYFLRWVTDLPRSEFEVHALYTGYIVDERTREYETGADLFAMLRGDLQSIAGQVRSRDLDLLVHLDVGMSGLSSLLASVRLAGRQLAAWGHPVTTGSGAIDAFISCRAMEPVDAIDHYTERLVLLPGLGVRYRPAHAAGAAMRERLGLTPDQRVYVMPQSLYKIHPATDALFAEILARDRMGVLILFAANTRGQTQAFAARVSRALAARSMTPGRQVKILPTLPRAEFLDVLGAADVMLDALHWSGGNTSLDALSMALPIVTWPGAFMRGRQTAAMLRVLGLDELIVGDAESYVDCALKVAADRDYRSVLSARIERGLPHLFDQPEPIDALAEALLACAAESP